MSEREKYIDRWLKEHPKLQIYLSREEYEWLQKLANEYKISIKELLIKVIKDSKEIYDKGYHDGYKDGYNKGWEAGWKKATSVIDSVIDKAFERLPGNL